MKKLFILIILLGFGLFHEAHAAFSLVATSTGINGSSQEVTSTAIDTTGADLIVVSASFNNSGEQTLCLINDSLGNTWTSLNVGGNDGSNQAAHRLYYAWNAIVGPNHTFAFNPTNGGSCGYPSIGVEAWKGSQTSADPFDVQNTSNTAVGETVTNIGTNSVTPSVNNELLVTGIMAQNFTNPAITSNFNISDYTPTTGNSYGHTMAYKIQTTAGAENPKWSWTSSNLAASSIATFKAAPATVAANPTSTSSFLINGASVTINGLYVFQ